MSTNEQSDHSLGFNNGEHGRFDLASKPAKRKAVMSSNLNLLFQARPQHLANAFRIFARPTLRDSEPRHFARRQSQKRRAGTIHPIVCEFTPPQGAHYKKKIFPRAPIRAIAGFPKRQALRSAM
jgi:hypothetical protein